MNRIRTALIVASAMLAGCASSVGADPVRPDAIQSDPVAADTLRQIAALLEQADDAGRRGDVAALGTVLAKLDAMAATPQGEHAGRMMEEWRALAPDAAPPLRGRALGPAFRTGRIAPAQAEIFEQTFLAGKRAAIVASTPSDAVLALQVSRADAAPVCHETARQSRCSWTPVFTGRYAIRISNPGREARRYFLVIE